MGGLGGSSKNQFKLVRFVITNRYILVYSSSLLIVVSLVGQPSGFSWVDRTE
jgi:hypothetical protein